MQHLLYGRHLMVKQRIAYPILTSICLLAAIVKVSAQSEEKRSVSGFNSIASSGPFEVHVKINGTESLRISASTEALSEIETPVENGKLQIRFKRHRDWDGDRYGKIDVYVTARSLSALTEAGSGTIRVEGTVTGDETGFVLSGSGEIEAFVKSSQVHAAISGSGSIDLKGNTGDEKINISGSGDFKGKQLKTNDATVTIAGSGNAYVNAEKTLSARLVGSGNVIYSGNATVDSHTVGSGRVSKE